MVEENFWKRLWREWNQGKRILVHGTSLQSRTKTRPDSGFLSGQNGHCHLTSDSLVANFPMWRMVRGGDVRLDLYNSSSVAVFLLWLMFHQAFKSWPSAPHCLICQCDGLTARNGPRPGTLTSICRMLLICFSFPSLPTGQFGAWVAVCLMLSTLRLIKMSSITVCNNGVRAYVMLMPGHFDKVIKHLQLNWKRREENLNLAKNKTEKPHNGQKLYPMWLNFFFLVLIPTFLTNSNFLYLFIHFYCTNSETLCALTSTYMLINYYLFLVK